MVRVAAEAATAVARNTDLIGWLPGERIIVIMPETDEDQARAAAFRWRNEMYSRTSHLGGLRWNATAINPFTYPSGDDLLQALSKEHIPGARAA
jgi:GGDEF domain-containing protein